MARVLVVDDEKSIRVTLKAFLTAKGHTTYAAQDADSAREILTNTPIDVVVSDIILPKVSGVELLRLIRESAPSVVVVMMTGEPTLDTATASLRAGAFEYLVKPVTKDVVCRIVDRAAQLKSLSDAKAQLEEENARYRERLEDLVRERTAELTNRREQLAAIFESSGDLLALVDEAHKIQAINHGGIHGDTVYSLFDSDDEPTVRRHLDGVLQTGHREQFDTVRSDGDGGKQFLAWVAAPVIVAGKVTGVVLSARDETERRNMQSQLAQADRLATMGMLAAGVAHEINNPLSYILNSLEFVVEDLPNVAAAARGERPSCMGVNEKAPSLSDLESSIQAALLGTQRVRDIARGLGTFARVEDDQLRPVNVAQAIQVATAMAFNELKYRATLVEELASTPPVLASDGRLSQVFLNLVLNAAHAIDSGSVRENEIRVRTWSDGDWVWAEVADTGKGIAPANLSRVFEPFFTTKNSGVGSGLGLPISKRIVESYGGNISVASKEGKGTSFTIRLPAMKAASPAADRRRTQAPVAPRSGRILVVDDEPAIRSVLARMLRRHEVLTVEGGVNAKQLLEQDQQFDLILCDVMMPDMAGTELHHWLTQHHPGLAERVVFMTGGAFTPHTQEYLGRLENPHIEKPFDTNGVREVVELSLDLDPKRALASS